MKSFESSLNPVPSVLEKVRNTPKEAKLLLTGLALILQTQTSKGQISDSVNKVSKDTISYNLDQKEKNSFDPNTLSVDDVYDRFTVLENGELKDNYWALLAPIQVDASITKEVQGIAKADVPYLYARNFDLAKATNPEDQKKIVTYIEQQLKKELVDAVTYLDFSDNTEKVYKARNESTTTHLNNLQIKSIKITGLASPEGPETKGSKSLLQGNVDQENISLAEKRAATIDPLVREALKNMGINENLIADIGGLEVQFSDEELQSLGNLASEFAPKNLSEQDAMFWITKEYNEGNFKNNPEVQQQLNGIFASKRGITIEIEYENKQKHTVVIPLPLTLLLLLMVRPTASLFKSAFAKERDSLKDIKLEVPEIDRYIFSERSEGEDVKKKLESREFKDLYNHAFEKVTPREFGLMMERMFVDEIYRYKDDERTKKLGLDYNLIAKVIRRRQEEKGEEIGAFEGTQILLSAWENYDRTVRDLEGLSKKEVVAYNTDLSKIAWARLTAEELVTINKKTKEGNRSFEEVLAETVSELGRHRLPRKDLVLEAGQWVPRKTR